MITDSKQKMLTVGEILQTAAEDTGVNRPLKEVVHMLQVELSLPNIWKCREGNTLFVVHKSAHPGYGFARTINADTAQNLVDNIIKFAHASYKAGFDVLVTQFDDERMMKVFQAIARLKPEGMGYMVQKTNSGGYQLTINLGPSRRDK